MKFTNAIIVKLRIYLDNNDIYISYIIFEDISRRSEIVQNPSKILNSYNPYELYGKILFKYSINDNSYNKSFLK